MILEQYLHKKFQNSWIRYNIQYIIFGIIIGTFLNILFQLVANNSFRSWKNVLMTYVISIFICVAITNVSILCAHITKKKFKSPFFNIALAYLLIVIGILIGSEASFLIATWIFDAPFSEFNNWKNIRLNMGLGFLAGTIIYMYQLQRDNYDLKIKDQEVMLLRLNEQKTQADLKTLQARINPHFLYNALNSITSLIHEEPAKAEEMTVNLSRLFRYSLNTQEANWATVKEELEIVSTYLDIERVRFGKRIRFDVDADESIKNVFIPRFLLQPLVENALKHGLKDKTSGGLLRVTVSDKNDSVEITVHDNGAPFPAEMLASYGLHSTNDKLQLLYGSAWKLNFINRDEKCVKLILPKKLEI